MLRMYEICTVSLNFYLCSHQKSVLFDWVLSSILSLLWGVIQGSVAVPTLHRLHGKFDTSICLSSHFYADDTLMTQLYTSGLPSTVVHQWQQIELRDTY